MLFILSRLAANLEKNFNYQRGVETSNTKWLSDTLRQSFDASLVEFAQREKKKSSDKALPRFSQSI